jgi:hypothetical protein
VVRSQEPREKGKVLVYMKLRVKWREAEAKGREESVRFGAMEGSGGICSSVRDLDATAENLVLPIALL